jgi:hypothetical protein
VRFGRDTWRTELFRCRWEDNIESNLKKIMMVWTGFIWPNYEPLAHGCEHGNDPSGCIKFSGSEQLLASLGHCLVKFVN